jgi:serine/threonine protein kinase
MYYSCISRSKKLGESSYAEVYQSIYHEKEVALKIIPFREYTEDVPTLDLYMTCLTDLYQEIAITRLLCREENHQIPPHFIKTEK